MRNQLATDPYQDGSVQRTRIDRTAHADRRSLAGHTEEGQVAADQIDAFLHRDEPEALAVVSHG